ncbi:hypothetical protein E4U56_007177 [Claviceps arundinis]|uniref:Uncharacterized protein n=1 Tax=Claviceps arundinis TaxID=1623583 RepID=A0A9P7MLI9_9HYPO|nr:hypothetical protein E4U56_007177 [Claviceps arundinis]
MAHGDINKHNFFLYGTGMKLSWQILEGRGEIAHCSHVELEDEMNALKDILESKDPRGGGIGAVQGQKI